MRAFFVSEFTIRSCLVLIGSAIGLLFIEFGIRIFYPTSIMTVEKHAIGKQFQPDEILGIRPVFGSSVYNDDGILFSESLFSNSGDPYKMLFIGDSVTAWGQITGGLVNLLGSETVSFLNAGVPSYNIQQEVDYFFGYLAKIKPHAIVHQLHVNDLTSSGVIRDRGDTVRIYSPRVKPHDV